MQPDADRDSPIVVTGAAGFLGSHVVTRLLAAGRRVRATVRDLDNAPKRAYLDELRARSPELLELFEADLMKPGSFDRCVDGAGAVIHTAASVRLTARDHRNIVEPSVEGTRNVVASMLAASVPRLVHTSSMAAVVRYKDARRGPFDEQDWNDESRPADDPYGFAKTRAERDLWELHAGRSEDSRFTLSVLCPSLILGPILAPHHRRASPAIGRTASTGRPWAA